MSKFHKLIKCKRFTHAEYLLQKKLAEPVIHAENGKDYVLTDQDKVDIASHVKLPEIELPEIPVPEDGKDYVLTNKDKQDISALIEPPPPLKGDPGNDYILKEEDKLEIMSYLPEPKANKGDPGEDLLFEALTEEDKTILCKKISEFVNVDEIDVNGLSIDFDKRTQLLHLLFDDKELSKDLIPYQTISYDSKKKVITISQPGEKDIEILVFTGGGGGGVVGDSTGLPYYHIPAGKTVTIPVNRQHLTVGPFTNDGTIINNGQRVVL